MKKRIVSLLIAVIMVAGLSMTAFASTKVSAIEAGVFVSSIDYTSGDTFTIGPVLTDVYDHYAPGAAINIFLDPTKFTGANFTPKTGMSASDLERGGVTFRIGGGKNSNLIQNIAYKEKTLNDQRVAMIQVQLVQDLASTEEKAFDTTVTVYANKVKQQSIKIAGTISGEEETLDASDTYVFLGKGAIAEPTENIAAIEADAGEGLAIHTRMFKGKKYAAVASISPTVGDIEVMNKHAEIELVYTLSTSGFVTADANVKITGNKTLYVYNEAGKYLGTTADKLPLGNKYYLANAEIDLSGLSGTLTDTGQGTTTEPDLPVPQPGDDILGPSTEDPATHIPDTGIGTLPKVALLALVGGLGLIGMLVLTAKKKEK